MERSCSFLSPSHENSVLARKHLIDACQQADFALKRVWSTFRNSDDDGK